MNIVSFLSFIFCFPLLAGHVPTGSIEVDVRLLDRTPELPVVVVDKNVPFCGEKIKDPILLTHEGSVINAVVYLDWQEKTAPPEQPENLSLKTRGCLIEPRVQTTRTGAFLHLNSGDSITHNPHGWLDGKRTVFNLTLTDPSLSFKRKLRQPGQYRIDCDTHSWMRAYILVFDHPYHAVTGARDKVVINGVPAGQHRIKIWHEVLGEQTHDVIVTAGKTTYLQPAYRLKDHREEKLKPETVTHWPAKVGLDD